MAENEAGGGNDQVMTDTSTSPSRTIRDSEERKLIGHCIHFRGKELQLVGTYANGDFCCMYGSDVYMTFDDDGKPIYEVPGYDDLRRQMREAFNVDLPDPVKVNPDHIEWFPEFRIQDDHKRHIRIFDAMLDHGATSNLGWASYNHLITDPGQRAEYQRRKKALTDRKYCVPTFERLRYCPGYEDAYYQSFLNGTFYVLDEWRLMVKKIVGNRYDPDSHVDDPSDLPKLCGELYLAISREADMFKDWLDMNRLIWTEVTEKTAYP